MNLKNKLKYALIDADMTQQYIANELHVSKQQVNHWVTGTRRPNKATLEKIAKILGKPLEYFASDGNYDDKLGVQSNPVMPISLIPILGVSSATEEKFILEEMEGYLPIPKTNDQQFAVKVSGNCMVDEESPNTSIYDGNFIVVDPEVEYMTGDVVLARIDDAYSTIKRLFVVGEKVRLVPDNKNYKAIVKPADEVKIVGKVVNVLHKPRRKTKE